MDAKTKATKLLKEWRGDCYVFGLDVLHKIGDLAAPMGKNVMLIANPSPSRKALTDRVIASLEAAGCHLAGGRIVPGAAPNAPWDDVYRIESYILHLKPDCIVVLGGGSSIDAAKASVTLAALGMINGELEPYFGVGLVSDALKKANKNLIPLIAIETAASSGSHLTKYSNVTNLTEGQKKLIIDEAIVPVKALFDYETTVTMPVSLTVDGALDGFSHCLEVFYGAVPAKYDLISSIALPAIELIVKYAKKAVVNPGDLEAREALGLATDLGGYAIMVGGTNGAHLTSFSLVDVTTHGKACGIMNPYYTVFFAPSVEKQLRAVGNVLRNAGYIDADLDSLSGRDLGIKVAEGMVAFNRSIGAPSKLSDLDGFAPSHIDRALNAAKNPQLESKLKNMPVPMTSEVVDQYMGPILRAAAAGDFSGIQNM